MFSNRPSDARLLLHSAAEPRQEEVGPDLGRLQPRGKSGRGERGLQPHCTKLCLDLPAPGTDHGNAAAPAEAGGGAGGAVPARQGAAARPARQRRHPLHRRPAAVR